MNARRSSYWARGSRRMARLGPGVLGFLAWASRRLRFFPPIRLASCQNSRRHFPPGQNRWRLPERLGSRTALQNRH